MITLLIAFKTKDGPYLRMLTGKKHSQIKLQRLQKLGIRAFWLMVHQINFL